MSEREEGKSVQSILRRIASLTGMAIEQKTDEVETIPAAPAAQPAPAQQPAAQPAAAQPLGNLFQQPAAQPAAQPAQPAAQRKPAASQSAAFQPVGGQQQYQQMPRPAAVFTKPQATAPAQPVKAEPVVTKPKASAPVQGGSIGSIACFNYISYEEDIENLLDMLKNNQTIIINFNYAEDENDVDVIYSMIGAAFVLDIQYFQIQDGIYLFMPKSCELKTEHFDIFDEE